VSYDRAREVLQEDLQTLDALRAALGQLSASEREKLAVPGLHDDPTEEELAFLGPDFVPDVMSLALEQLERPSILPERSLLLFQGGLRLLTILKEIEDEETQKRLMDKPTAPQGGGQESPAISEKRVKLAAGLVDLWQELRAVSD
jgi:hypothetical protein